MNNDDIIKSIQDELHTIRRALGIIDQRIEDYFEVKGKDLCTNCYDNEYNQGLGGAEGCWHLDTAEIVMKKEVPINQRPPWNQEAKRTLSCYKRMGFIYVGEDKER